MEIKEDRSVRTDLNAKNERDFDLHLVTFEGPDDLLNPLNWPRRRKWSQIAMMSAMTLLVYKNSSSNKSDVPMLTNIRNLATLMCAPAAPSILKELSSSDRLDETLIVSVWELGEAFGPLLIAPLSEMVGRSVVYQSANIVFLIFSLVSGFSKNMSMLIVFRFFNGIAVASVVLNPSIVGDMFIVEQRGNAMSILSLAPLLGPCLGPIAGGYISQSIGWRWIFWLAAVLAAGIEIAFVLFFRETYKVHLLREKARNLRKHTGDASYQSEHDEDMSVKSFFTSSILRPVRMMILSPMILFLSLYVSVVFAYTYIMFTTMTEVFQSRYGFSTGSAGLTFLGLGNRFFFSPFTS
ncbi:MAG: hypothetical protein Q9190_004695 [Brigantiaea leucoxantha]